MPFLESLDASSPVYVPLVGKVLVGTKDSPHVALELSGNGAKSEHCRITALGERIVLTPLNAVRTTYFLSRLRNVVIASCIHFH